MAKIKDKLDARLLRCIVYGYELMIVTVWYTAYGYDCLRRKTNLAVDANKLNDTRLLAICQFLI